MKSNTLFYRNRESGQVSKLLLILAVVVFAVGVVAYLIIAANNKPKSQAEEQKEQEQAEAPKPVYEKQLGDIKFVFVSAVDFGQTLSSANIVNEKFAKQAAYQQSLQTTTGRFIQVTVGATNLGKIDTLAASWNLLNIVDSEGRNFIPSKSYLFDPWIPEGDGCGDILKPAFEPVLCTKIYEVSKESTGLKVTVENKKSATSKEESASKATTDTLDIVVR